MADSVEVRDKADNLYWSLEGKGQRLVINNDAFVFAGPSEMKWLFKFDLKSHLPILTETR